MGYTIHISFSLQIRQSTESIKFSLNIPENHLKSENGESITNKELTSDPEESGENETTQ